MGASEDEVEVDVGASEDEVEVEMGASDAPVIHGVLGICVMIAMACMCCKSVWRTLRFVGEAEASPARVRECYGG